MAGRLLRALTGRDQFVVASMFDPDAHLVIDSGDETAGRWEGRARIAGILLGRLAKQPDASLMVVHVNGGPGLALRRPDGAVLGVLVIGGRPRHGEGSETSVPIRELYLTTAPHKLLSWNREPLG
ncbi:hypothetical protein [Agromyces larvae]|uniref:Nuclear transport factor 2 family protein n=1 Tax=Agromyces larvae TaxID=2929802 RepID=A0ABY4C2B4_9MICO|nr:hypothetical protein [Agromyces larvae]UOE44113.1 hypothetical protein MTO99_18470 [Agromyces larvae]